MELEVIGIGSRYISLIISCDVTCSFSRAWYYLLEWKHCLVFATVLWQCFGNVVKIYALKPLITQIKSFSSRNFVIPLSIHICRKFLAASHLLQNPISEESIYLFFFPSLSDHDYRVAVYNAHFSWWLSKKSKYTEL